MRLNYMNKELICKINLSEVDISNFKFCGVECVILTQDNKIILQQRGENWQRFPGYLSNFGGQIEPGETPIQALIRELNEELGAKVNPQDVISLGAITEAATNHRDLIYVFFWHDNKGSINGCYEGSIKYFDSAAIILKESKIMDSVRWALNECQNHKLMP